MAKVIHKAGLNTPDKIVTTDSLGNLVSTLDIAIATGISLGQVLFVSLSGTTGVVGSISQPYDSITAANVDAVSGDLVIVYPGDYDESQILKDGVNYFFHPNANIVNSSNNPIFDDAGGAITSSVLGFGKFSTSGTSSIANFSAVANNIKIEGLEFTDNGGGCVILQSTATGNYEFSVDTLGSSGTLCIQLAGNASVIVNTADITASGGNAINLESTFDGTAKIRNSSLRATTAGSAVSTIFSANAAVPGILILENTKMSAANASAFSIEAGGAGTLTTQLHGWVLADKPTSGAVTLTIGSLVVDSTLIV